MAFDCLTMIDDVRDNGVDVWWMYTLGRALSRCELVIGSRSFMGRLLNARHRDGSIWK